MADLRPFAAYRPKETDLLEIASPPYDVISTEEARRLARDKPLSFLHVSRPEIDLPEGTDEHDDVVYRKGAENLTQLIDAGALNKDASPRLYLYAQEMKGHYQVGVVGCAAVRDYEEDRIKKHEKTRADKEDDRTKHIEALRAHDEPVFLTYRADREIDACVKRQTAKSATYDFSTSDGVKHKFWVLSDEATAELEGRFRRIPTLYVADGHHRSAAAARVNRKLSGSKGEHDAFLSVVFPHNQMNIMPYNRVVRDLTQRSSGAILSALKEVLDLERVENAEAATPREPKTFGIFFDSIWYRACVRKGSYKAEDPVQSLDCSICQDQVLEPIFGVTDPRRDKHVDFVGGIRGTSELEARVNSGQFTMAIHLFPTQIEELFRVSDQGLLMPPKSTWFEPKLRSGLFLHAFD